LKVLELDFLKHGDLTSDCSDAFPGL